MHDERIMIHPTALIDKGAEIDNTAVIGPYTIVGPEVVIGANTTVGSHAVIAGKTSIGEDNKIFHHVSLGEIPQDMKYKNEDTTLTIGNGNVIREFCTFNLDTVQDRSDTQIGNKNWIMAYVHVAHDCILGDNIILANCVQLGGHVVIDNNAFLGGFTGVHQFCRIGTHAMAGVGSVVLADIIPYVTVMGNRARPYGVNTEGLKRSHFSLEDIAKIKFAYKLIFRSGLSLEDALQKLKEANGDNEKVNKIIKFINNSKRSIVR